MDARRFEEISRRVATARSRRDALRAAVAALGAGVFGIAATGDAGADETRGVPIYHCKAPGQTCNRDRNCCSGKCKTGVCTCAKKGNRCFEPLEGSLCCSGRCNNGKCK